MGILSQVLTIILLFGATVFSQYESDDFEDEYENAMDNQYPSIFHHIPYSATPAECAKECFCPPAFPVSMYCDHRKLQTIPSIPTHIQQLYLQYNDIEAVPVEPFVNATALREVNLSHNKIKSHMIDTGAFAKLSNLVQLHLEYNLLEEIPSPLPRSLQRLILGFNQISRLPSKDLEGLANVTMLDLCNNYLEDPQVKKIHFSNMKNLMQINLCSNRLQSMPPDLPFSLMYLSLENNSISFIPDHYFQKLPKLIAIRMSYNNLQEVPYNVFNLSNLMELNLGHNKLKQIFYIPRSLQHLYIEDNDMEAINVTLMCPSIDPLNFSHLTYIRVDQNKLTAPISTYAFFCFPHVHSIYYGEQKISANQQTQLRTPVFRRYLTPEEYDEAEDYYEEQDRDHDQRGRDDNHFDPYLY
ncbi:osteomodulin [Rhineura floridana]|uniref:osteomodulin n=1 Tax=Rhineura floridana TaxID=261503 RepID=UPI002AC7F3B2|nr:osteomodulin [Rhineura floridana]XP_061474046.1 osteomodulin [Rhineura floridana]XP_061474047.1 osteomodulin [Rhineura floridana]XP_061474048.1 osteomodulin [Rhineura floridana]XP_061474049.1 osteomodulin [Rhineura floridana]XP_061474050.1 osteomodulin [Rhineura floridana]